MKPGWRDLRRDPVLLLACGFGSGLAPRAPGTAGSLLGALLWLALVAPLPWPVRTIVVAIAIAGGVWLCSAAVARLGGVRDHPSIVWDEIAGVWLALWLVPPGWPGWLAALVAFRVLDIAKPWPINLADRRLGGGLGVMADDVLAGLFAGIVVALSLYWIGGM